MPTATYGVYVDWNNDGDFIDAGEDVTGRVRANPGLRTMRGRDQIRVLAPPMAGRFDAELNNHSRDYSPENSGSPLYGNLLPGRKVQAKATFGGVTYTLFTGCLDDIPQHPERGQRSVSIPALGSLSRLAGKTASTALYQNITTAVALGHLLDAIGWPAGDRVIDTGRTTLQWWWLDNEDALAAAKALLASEGPGAALYEDGRGRIVFEGRHYRQLTARCNTSQVTFRDTGAEPKFVAPFSYNPNLKDIHNVCEIEVKTRAAQSLGVVWTLGQTLTMAAGQVRTVLAKASDPFTAAVAPVASTDYTVTAGSISSVSLNRTSGASVTITLTAGASGATVTGLQLRAQSVTVTNTSVVANNVDAAASIAKYGQQVYTHAMRAEAALNDAQDLADAIVGLYMEPRPTVMITVDNGADDRLTQALTREISDRVTIVEAQTGISAAFYIEQIAHEVTAAGGVHRTTFGCEKITSNAIYATWGGSTWGSGIWGF